MNVYWQCFLFGLAGNTAVETVKILGYIQSGKYPRMYNDWRFWAARLVFMVIAGGIALALAVDGVTARVIAFHAGAAATLVVGKMAARLPVPSPNKGMAQLLHNKPGTLESHDSHVDLSEEKLLSTGGTGKAEHASFTDNRHFKSAIDHELVDE
jgi:hypothetical protein